MNIKLAKNPASLNSNRENCSDSGRFDYRTEGFSEVNSRQLMKSFGHQVRFIVFNGTIGITLNPKYPFASNDIASSVKRNPRLIF